MANITEKYQQAKDAGYTDAEIQAFMAGAMKTGGPGVDMPGLPDSRMWPTPKNFPGFGKPAAEYATRQEPVTRMMDGAARMTRAGSDAKFGGASDIMRGAGEIALPLAAVPLAGAGSLAAGAGMLGRMAIGAGAGYATGKAARSLVPEDKPGLQDFAENAGATAGGLLAGGAAESPKVGAFIKGAVAKVPEAMTRSGTYGMGGLLMHSMGHGKAALAADAIAAAKGLPTVIRGGMAEAAGKPWLGPVASELFGVNSSKPAPQPPVNAGTSGIRDFKVGPPSQSMSPSNVSWQSGTSGKPGGLLSAVETPAESIARQQEAFRNIEALKARQAAKAAPPQPSTPKSLAPSENAAARMAKQDAEGKPRTGLMGDAVADAEKRGAWNVNSGNKGETLTKLKQDALIKFADENKLPMVDLSESDYNTLVTAFNKTKPVHPLSGKPWRVGEAGVNNKSTGFGRDVETTLRHFNNMRLGRK
jgi:hypothetical protein